MKYIYLFIKYKGNKNNNKQLFSEFGCMVNLCIFTAFKYCLWHNDKLKDNEKPS